MSEAEREVKLKQLERKISDKKDEIRKSKAKLQTLQRKEEEREKRDSTFFGKLKGAFSLGLDGLFDGGETVVLQVAIQSAQEELDKLERKYAKLNSPNSKKAKKLTPEDKKMHEVLESTKRDIRFSVERKVLKNVTTLAEIQRVEDEYMDAIIKNEELTPEQRREQIKQLQRDCDEARKELRTKTSIYEED
jgi:hypothetical protein